MSTYLVGDVQGCYHELLALMEKISFSPGMDEVIFVGDLVNRGPDSLKTLRWAKEHGQTVLGNHDLHLLAVAMGARTPSPEDTFFDVLEAKDKDTLIGWLIESPFWIDLPQGHVVHAGVLPNWDAATARALSQELSMALLRHPKDAFTAIYAPGPRRWQEDLDEGARLHLAAQAFTRIRAVTEEGEMLPGFVGPLEDIPPRCHPWFAHPRRQSRGQRIFFGHWAALGLWISEDAVGLDAGCAWGRSLLAYCLQTQEVIQVPARHLP